MFVSCASKPESEAVVKINSAAPPTEILAKSDELFKQRADLSKLREAVKMLDQIRNPDARNFETEWKFAKYNYFLGRMTKAETESEKAFADGEKAGTIALRLAPDKPDGYFWYAANLGEAAKRAPVTKGLTSIDELQNALNKVIEIDPKYQNASAFDGLAQIELATTLVKGKPAKAVEYLEKGIEIEKDNSYLYLHLAEALLMLDRKEDAKKQLRIILQMKPNPDYLPEYRETAEQAKKLLQTRF